MSKWSWSAFLMGGALALGLVTSPLGAQQLDSTALVQLHPQRLVRIESAALGRVTGTVVSRSPSEILLAGETEQVIAVESIRRAWVRGRHTGTGAIIGGILGAGGGLFLGLIVEAVCEYDCSDHPALPLTFLGAGVGAGAGAIVGSAFPRWKELH